MTECDHRWIRSETCSAPTSTERYQCEVCQDWGFWHTGRKKIVRYIKQPSEAQLVAWATECSDSIDLNAPLGIYKNFSAKIRANDARRRIFNKDKPDEERSTHFLAAPETSGGDK